eukprot:14047230-Alexandrium_andersonii.AAC.1
MTAREADGMIDYEALVSTMKVMRSWSEACSKEYWEQLEADPDVDDDEGGPPWSKKRLRVPSNVLANDTVENARA